MLLAAGKFVIQPALTLTELPGLVIEQFGRHMHFYHRRPIALGLSVAVG